MKNNLMLGDCLERMKEIESGSVDMILTDPPYGTTACKWDSVIDLELMWEQLKRIIKPNGAIVMTASQPFTSALIMSNIQWFKYETIYEKSSPTNPFMAKKQVMKRHENVLIFYKNQCAFNPQMSKRLEKNKRNNIKDTTHSTSTLGSSKLSVTDGQAPLTYPSSVKKFNRQTGLHPTQKPVALMEYLIKTYTNENETVLDFTMGSGTTGVACKNLNRDFIGIEMDEGYFNIAKNRIESA
jgi:site-specific DNA-methyltransferase (adenine-specific)